MPLLYADLETLAEHMSELPDDADTLLAAASIRVRAATKNDIYDVLPSGLPVDLDKAQAMADATCAQVVEWAANQIDPAAGVAGLQPVAASASVNGASLGYVVTDQATARARSLTHLCDTALLYLRNAGLASAAVG